MLAFVDTSAWIAVSIINDINHDQARQKLERLVAAKDLLLTSNYVLDETYTRLRYDAGLETAVTFHAFLMEAIAAGYLRLEPVSKGIEAKAWEIFTVYRDQTFSYTDHGVYPGINFLEIEIESICTSNRPPNIALSGKQVIHLPRLPRRHLPGLAIQKIAGSG